MDRETFEELVAKAIDGLPREFAERLDNVAILVDDYPSRWQLRKSRVPPGSTLLGFWKMVILSGNTIPYSWPLRVRGTPS